MMAGHDGLNTLTYDAEGRLATSYSPIFGVTSSYFYDAGGQRVSKIFGSYETDYVHDPGGALLTTYVNGSYFGNFQDLWVDGRHFGEVVMAAGNASQTQNFSLTDWLGSQAAYTDPATGVPNAAYVSQPFGDAQTTLFGSNNDDIHFTGKERDGETGNDYFGARYYASTMGRLLSPDPLGGHTEDPQTLNKYAYVRNNPLILTDPTGLDFNLQCTSGNLETCQNGIQGTTTTDADGKSIFTATVISNNKNGGLVDQNGNKYSATVSGAGVSFTEAGSKQSSIGTFINGTNATTIQGSGALSGFTFTFTGSKMASNVNATGTFTYNGTASQAVAELQQAGFQHYTQDEYLDPYHLSTDTYNAYDLRSPGGQQGAGAGHVMVEFPVSHSWGADWDLRIPITTVPTNGTLDLGDHNPWNGGFGAHVNEILQRHSQ